MEKTNNNSHSGLIGKGGIRIANSRKKFRCIIAMTSHGGGGLSRVFYGRVASGVLNRVDRPLLLIRTRKEA